MNYLQDLLLDNLNIVFNLGGFFSINNRDWTYPKHRFEQCKFYFIVDGSCEITIENKTYIGNAGDWFFIPAGTEHSYKNHKEKPFKKYWAHFDVLPDVEFIEQLKLPYKIKAENFNKIKNIFSKLHKAISSNKFCDKLLIKSYLFNLLSEFISQSSPYEVEINNIRNVRIDKVLRYINENLDKQLTLDDLAKQYFSHPNHFIRAFKDKTGSTPIKYIKQKKMERAKLLLETTDLTVNEIAEKLCFTDGAHLCRLFKEYFNTTPIKHREYNQHKNDKSK